MKGRRERIALEEGLENVQPGLGQAGVVQGHSHNGAWTPLQSAFPDGLEEVFGIPGTARMQFVFRAPRLLLSAIGPNDPGDGAPPQTEQTAQSLAQGPVKAAWLAEDFSPPRSDLQKGLQQARLSGTDLLAGLVRPAQLKDVVFHGLVFVANIGPIHSPVLSRVDRPVGCPARRRCWERCG
jgi:hypothetical protein